MVLRQTSALAATFLLTAVFGASGVRAQDAELPATVIVACDHSVQTRLETLVSGVEFAGGVPGNLAAALQTDTSCARAFHRLGRAGFALVNRLTGLDGDFDGDGDVDGRDFLIWQRQTTAPRSESVATVLLRCDYRVADGLVTRVAGRQSAGTIPASLAAALAAGPSCAEAYAQLAAAGFGLLSAAPAPTAGVVDGSDFLVWQRNYGAAP